MTRSQARRGACARRLLLFGLALVLGCGRTPGTVKPPSVGKEEDPLATARALARQADGVDDYKRVLEAVNGVLSNGQGALPPPPPRELLTGRLGLEDDEALEVCATQFSPLDAHYLEFCCILRDAARVLRLNEAVAQDARLGQVRRGFDWVIRQVVLRQKGAELEPPEFALREGRGGGRERALVFLTLVRQMGLAGCVVTCSGAKGDEPRPWLAGVLLPGGKGEEVYLFEPRLGVPLPGPKGGVATLADLRRQPDLVRRLARDDKTPYDVTPEQAARAEVALVFPLPALSARMRYLEGEVFASQDRVGLALQPEPLLERFEKAVGGKVQVWNRRGEPGKPAPRTPTRVLRLSLPPGEGGVDKGGRYDRHRVGQLAPVGVALALRELRLAEDIERGAEERVREWIAILFRKYVQAPHEQLLRGRTEESSRQLVRLRTAVEEYQRGMPEDAEFAKEYADWREKVRKATLDKVRGKAEAAKALDDLWMADTHLLDLLGLLKANPGEEINPQQLRRGIPGLLVFRVAGEPLRAEVDYLQALRWHEIAEAQQARVEQQAAGAMGHLGLQEQARQRWQTAQARWEGYHFAHPLTPKTTKPRLQISLALLQRGGLGDAELALGLIGAFFDDACRSLHARLLQARALAKGGQAKAARAALEQMLRQVDAVEAPAELQALRKEALAQLLPSEAFFCLRCRAALELRALAGKGG